ncbi:DUF1761 domain-containing protein [Aquimarina brevivitae]|uniref:Uncharacterized protein DUF1761 n=1 Tax=Aquimarina brevivitae TaxID=323412 RepID=A0A4Q7NYE5_9FLAO|nr:DUF1761 domain-containing protein [Aquimarina brevivitae]RZS92443.1 uncharacterized protein DUF1761 [Aquimarina brevivitae]
MEFNFLIAALAALIPLVVGFIWYNPKVFGTSWMKVTALNEENLKQGNMAIIFILSYIFSLLLAVMLNTIVIHQFGFYSTLMSDPDVLVEGTELNMYAQDFMAKYGQNFRTFKHGAFHGLLAGLFIALPILGTNALFERKGFKYIGINVGYWTITLALMGGVICQFA